MDAATWRAGRDFKEEILMMNRIHCLKTWPIYYAAVLSGDKTFEIRKDDRDFKVGDALVLQEFEPDKQSYTGQMTARRVTYILRSWPALQDGYVIMGIKPWSKFTAEGAQTHKERVEPKP